MRIAHRLLAGFLLPGLLVVVVGVNGFISSRQVLRSHERTERHFSAIIDAATEASSYVKRAEGHLMLFLTLEDEADRRKFSTRMQQLSEQFRLLDQGIQNPGGRAFLERMRAGASELGPVGLALIAAYDREIASTGHFDFAGHAREIRRVNELASSIREQGVELAVFEADLESGANALALDTATRTQKRALVVIVGALLAAAVGGALFSRSIAAPITALKRATERLATGSFDSPIEVRSGGEVGSLATSFNEMMGQLRAAREALLAARDYAENILTAMTSSVIVTSEEGVIEKVNAAVCAVLGSSESELVGRPITDFLAAEDGGETRWAEVRGLIRGGTVRSVERLLRTCPGGTVHVLLSGSSMHDPSGSPRGMVIVAQDITEHRRTEEMLRQALKMEAVGRLAGGVAHDFNNLLTVISGFSDVVLAQLGPDHQVTPEVEEIRKAAERAASLTQQLLAFSRRQVFELKAIDVNAILRNMQGMLRRLIGEHIALRVNTAPDLGPIHADASRIEQVILNLSVNARDAMPKGGTLTLETQSVDFTEDTYLGQKETVPPGSYTCISVSDTGTGIDADTQLHIFEPFFTTKGRGKGTGLGLATVYGIVKQSSGFISIESEPGRGSRFTVYLPRLAGHVVDENEVKPEVPGRARDASETVLLVEDEDAVRRLARTALQAASYSVLETQDGREALTWLEDERLKVSLLLTDVVMPGLSGPDLAKQAIALRPRLKVLLMSGYTDPESAGIGIADSGWGFLQKPFAPAALADRVRRELDRA